MKAKSFFLLLLSLLFSILFVSRVDAVNELVSEVRNINELSDRSNLYGESSPETCDGINTLWGKAYCECNMEVSGGQNNISTSRQYCGEYTIRIDYDHNTVPIINFFIFNINTRQRICDPIAPSRPVAPWGRFAASCEFKQYKAPDACLCAQNTAYAASTKYSPIVVDKNLNVLANDVVIDADGKITSGKIIEAQSPEFKADYYTLSTGAQDEKLFLTKVLSKKADYVDFRGGTSCVPVDTFWDCSRPVFFDETEADVCCCAGTKCVKKSVFTKGIQVCGAENQIPVPPSGKCDIEKQDIGKISGMDLDVLRQRAASELNPKEFTDPTNFLGRMIAGMMANVGAIAIALYIWAGFTWMTAQGNQEKLTKAKQILLWTSLGLVVMLSSYILVSFIFKDVLGL